MAISNEPPFEISASRFTRLPDSAAERLQVLPHVTFCIKTKAPGMKIQVKSPGPAVLGETAHDGARRIDLRQGHSAVMAGDAERPARLVGSSLRRGLPSDSGLYSGAFPAIRDATARKIEGRVSSYRSHNAERRLKLTLFRAGQLTFDSH